MTQRLWMPVVVLVLLGVLGVPVRAHHSPAAFDRTKEVTLVVETKNFIEDEHRWVDQGVRASGELRIVERIRLINGGRTLEIQMTLTDPKNWEGDYTGTRRWNRVDDVDIAEVECLPDLNDHLQSMSSKVHVR